MNPRMPLLASVALLPCALLSIASCSSTSTPPPPAPESNVALVHVQGVPGGVRVATLDVWAKVTAIDTEAREVKLMDSKGKEFTVQAGPEVKNFGQLRVGDQVHASVTEELVVQLEGEGAPAAEGTAALIATAPEGAKPGGLLAATTQVTASVVAIDAEARTATLRFEDGSIRTFPVRDDLDLSQRKLGERVVFRVTESIALSIDTSS